MCGRITKYRTKLAENDPAWERINREWDKFKEIFRLDAEAGGAQGYNIGPGTHILSYIYQREEDGELVAATGRWGLEPKWVAEQGTYDVKRGFNNRADAILGTRPGSRPYRFEIAHRRALVIADSFYEWLHPSIGKDPKKRPWVIRRREQQPLLFAALHAEHTWGRSVGIITTDPNDEIAKFHHRMPVILEPQDVQRWLDPSLTKLEDVADLIRTTPSEWFEIYRVPQLPRTGTGGPELLEPLVEA